MGSVMKKAAMVAAFNFRVRANVLILVFVGMLVASFAVSLGIQHVGPRFATLENELRLPAYNVLDAALTARLSPGIHLQIAGENLLDARYLMTAQRRASQLDQGAIVVGWPGTPRSVRVRRTSSALTCMIPPL
jgi:outer membrane receptor for monomeric catechols